MKEVVISLYDKKIYLQPMNLIYTALLDLMELQKGKEILNDFNGGRLFFNITMYGLSYNLRFSVLEIDWKRCRVTLEAETENKEDKDYKNDKNNKEENAESTAVIIRREFALLDSMLLIASEAETGILYGGADIEKSGRKKYLQPPDMLLNAVRDLAELQKGIMIFSDSPNGIVRFKVVIYATEYEYRFTVTDIGSNRCSVIIEIENGGQNARRLIKHEFALLDYVLDDRTALEFAEIDEEDKKIAENSKKYNKSKFID